MSRRLCLALVAAWGLACASAPTPPLLRVATSGDYAPFSQGRPEAPENLAGFDVEALRAFAAAEGLRIQWLRFRWPELLVDLAAGSFDVAVGGVTVRPERSLAGRFSIAGVEGGALVLHRDPARFAGLDALDTPGLRIAVNTGGHLERVARARFPRARIVTLANDEVPRALAEGRADAVVTDVFEAPHWLRRLPGATPLGPFTRDRKAWLMRADRPELARRLDAWLLAREADGSLAELRARHLGLGRSPPTARPLPALVAAMDERLALMPAVAEAKRSRGLAVTDPERERRVLAATAAAVRSAAEQAGLPPPPEAGVRRLFQAQIAAARRIQERVLAGPAAAGAPASLSAELRPALLRIGERIAWLLVRLPADLEPGAARRAVAEGLGNPDLGAAARDEIAGALAELVATR